jgi:capsid protein
MFEFISAWLEKKRCERERYRFAQKRLEEAYSLIRDEDEREYQLLGSGEGKGFSELDQATMLSRARELWKGNPHARGIIRTLEKFVLGRGVRIVAHDENPKVQEWWEEFVRENDFERRTREIVRRSFRDGECFLRYFINEETGKVRIRFLEPEEIADPEGKISYGIETDPDDIENPLRYFRASEEKLIEVIPADLVQHIKILVDSNVKRGLSFLYGVMPLITKYEQWLNDRIVLNKIRSAVAIVRKVSAPRGELASFSREGLTDCARRRMWKPGSIITVSDGVDYQILSPNLQAHDVQYDGRNILLSIASGCGLAEYMVSADASNANYASTMVAESPSVREFEDWQQFFEAEFAEIFRRVIRAGIDSGALPAERMATQKETAEDGVEVSREVLVKTSLSCDVLFPPLVHRNLKDETEALKMHKEMSIISNHTLAGKLGYDYRVELSKMEKEGDG